MLGEISNEGEHLSTRGDNSEKVEKNSFKTSSPELASQLQSNLVQNILR
jgi:hypothetical protein